MALMFRNRRMNKQIKVQLYNTIPQQREQTTDTCDDMGASRKLSEGLVLKTRTKV